MNDVLLLALFFIGVPVVWIWLGINLKKLRAITKREAGLVNRPVRLLYAFTIGAFLLIALVWFIVVLRWPGDKTCISCDEPFSFPSDDFTMVSESNLCSACDENPVIVSCDICKRSFNPKNGMEDYERVKDTDVCYACWAEYGSTGSNGGSGGSGYSSSSTDVDTATCKFCGRTFKAGTSNYMNIQWANMCNNCEDNLKAAKEAGWLTE